MSLHFAIISLLSYHSKKKAQPRLSFLRVPEIGVEPTRREALAPETSVSTISPLGLGKVAQRYKIFLIYELFFSFISLSHIYIPCPTP